MLVVARYFGALACAPFAVYLFHESYHASLAGNLPSTCMLIVLGCCFMIGVVVIAPFEAPYSIGNALGDMALILMAFALIIMVAASYVVATIGILIIPLIGVRLTFTPPEQAMALLPFWLCAFGTVAILNTIGKRLRSR